MKRIGFIVGRTDDMLDCFGGSDEVRGGWSVCNESVWIVSNNTDEDHNPLDEEFFVWDIMGSSNSGRVGSFALLARLQKFIDDAGAERGIGEEDFYITQVLSAAEDFYITQVLSAAELKCQELKKQSDAEARESIARRALLRQATDEVDEGDVGGVTMKCTVSELRGLVKQFNHLAFDDTVNISIRLVSQDAHQVGDVDIDAEGFEASNR